MSMRKLIVALSAGLAWTAGACIDGARLEGPLPDGFDFGPPPPDVSDTVDTADAEPDADGDAADAEIEVGACTVDADCAPLNGGLNLCDSRYVCDTGTGDCVLDEARVTCEPTGDEPACQRTACIPSTGECGLAPGPNGVACDDGDDCTTGDYCMAGACTSNGRIYCDDGNPCTSDLCVLGECSYAVGEGLPCDDGNSCTTDDHCNASGVCAGGASTCACTVDADCAAFDDGNVCTGTLKCLAGTCAVDATTIPVCNPDDAGPCEQMECDPTDGCQTVPVPDGYGCSDGQTCTVDDQCVGGACMGTPIVCDDAPCVTSTCVEDAGCSDPTPVTEGEECECAVDADCADLNPADACFGTVRCLGGACVLDPASIGACAAVAGDPCRTCDAECNIVDVAAGEPCDDGSPCTEDTQCDGNGSCGGGAEVICDGTAACNVGVCHEFAGCKILQVGGTCQDGNFCTTGDSCHMGACQPGLPKTCPDDNDCADVTCDPQDGSCVATPITGDCDDGDACTAGDTCVAGACEGQPVFCDDGNPCTSDACTDGSCEFTNNTKLCSDGASCTLGDTCTDGACVGTTSVCACTEDADCAAFDDGNACNGTLRCESGGCVPDEATKVVCDPSGNTLCSENACNPATGQCEMVPRADGASCSDGDACTVQDVCNAGACAGVARVCSDNKPCTDDACDPVQGCTFTPVSDGTTCDDGNSCTTGDVCTAGLCAGTPECGACQGDADCQEYDDGDLCNGQVRCINNQCALDPSTVVKCAVPASPCKQSVCNPSSGVCITENANEGGACEDGNPCTSDDACDNGVCVGTLDTCTGNTCGTGVCNTKSGKCELEAKPGLCDDGNPCTDGDACQQGSCLGGFNNCQCDEDADCAGEGIDLCQGTYRCISGGCVPEAGTEVVCDTSGDTPCSYTTCEPLTGQCVKVDLKTGTECDDGDACTKLGRCDAAGACVSQPVVCDDGKPCTLDTCDPAKGCKFTLQTSGACDDGDACTEGTECNASGVCTGGTNSCDCTNSSQCPTGETLCTGQYQCVGGKCKKQPPVICAASGLACKVNKCNPATGLCGLQNATPGTPCVDNNPCTSNDACLSGVCTGNAISCNDSNTCTTDSCSLGKCDNVPVDGGDCDDANPCTVLTKCSDGVCGGGFNTCSCQDDGDCVFYDDGNACNGVWHCNSGQCEPKPNSNVVCLDDDPFDCKDPVCSPSTGQCQLVNRPNGQACDDGTVCTINDKCTSGGTCLGTINVLCSDDDPNDCVTSSCHPVLGECVTTVVANGTSCNDGDPCTENDRCAAGGCTGDLKDCDDGKVCTVDGCSPQLGCFNVVQYGACDDGNPCTSGEKCVNGSCQAGTNVCECTVEADCDVLETDLCAGDWICMGGECVVEPDSEVVCEPSTDPCTDNVCDPSTGACSAVARPDDLACDDGDPCTTAGRCIGGACVGEPIDCDDGNTCSDDTCDAGDCVHTPLADGAACDDGIACNGDGFCQAGACLKGVGNDCPCTTNADCAAFEDGDLCNGTYECGPGGRCRVRPTTIVTCPADPTGCSELVCDPASGDCLPDPVPDGTLCNDGDPCTIGDTCQAGACMGTPEMCDDNDPCTADSCDPDFGCIHEDYVGPCDDGSPCTIDDTCSGGTCSGVQNPCDDGNECTNDGCQLTQGCVHFPKGGNPLCDDGNSCTSTEACDANGQCTASTNTCPCDTDANCVGQGSGNKCLGPLVCVNERCEVDPAAKVVCPDGDDCISYACNPATGACVATPTADDTPCDDGDACTTGETCQGGACVGDPVTCTPTEDECRQTVCDPVGGCQDIDAAGACDDGDSCTGTDRCVEGACKGVEAVGGSWSFDDADAPGWMFSDTATTAGWFFSGQAAISEPLSLWAGNPDTGTMADPAGAWTAVALLPPVTIPADSVAAELRFVVKAGLGDASCGADTFNVRVNGSGVYSVCDSTDGFELVVVDLGLFIGDTVDLDFFVSVNATANGGSGVFVDDVSVEWSCPVGGN